MWQKILLSRHYVDDAAVALFDLVISIVCVLRAKVERGNALSVVFGFSGHFRFLRERGLNSYLAALLIRSINVPNY